MATRDRADIAGSLLKKGFVLESKKRDHDFYFLEVEGFRTQIYTKLSRGSSYKTYNKQLLGMMKNQLKLTNEQLLELIDCPMDLAKYLNVLVEQGAIDKKKFEQKKGGKQK